VLKKMRLLQHLSLYRHQVNAAAKTSKLSFQYVRKTPLNSKRAQYCPILSRRCFSDSNRDTRLAGRRRFYKHVGVQSVGAPWEEETSSSGKTIDSPISAGVDGTQSASGVKNTLPSNNESVMRQMLLPRKPAFDLNNGTITPNTEKMDTPINWYGITLDGRAVKTPLGQSLSVPSEMLAWAIAAEWDAQKDYLQVSQMPLMTLACTALDQTSPAPDIVQEQALKYLLTDTICYWADPTEDRILHRKQQQAWDGIHNHCENIFGDKAAIALGTNEGLLMSRVRDNKTVGLPHPENVVVGAKKIVESLDAWHLTALSSVTQGSKSLLVALATLTGGADPKVAIEASRVEEEFQISGWGLVEGGHDYDRLNCSIQVYSAHAFISSIAIDNNL